MNAQVLKAASTALILLSLLTTVAPSGAQPPAPTAPFIREQLAASEQRPPSQEPQRQVAPTLTQSESPAPGTGHAPLNLDLSHLKGSGMPQAMSAAALTSRFDWREQGVVTPVQQQGACGSCYAFAFLASFESKLQIDGAGIYDFSENNAKECPWRDPSCGGSNAWEMAGWFSEKGTVQESCDPYVASDVSCKGTCPYIKTLLDWRYISQGTPDTAVLKGYIQTYGPVYTSMYAGDTYDPFWQQEFSGYDGSYTLYYDGMVDRPNHGVLIVGWDDSLSHSGGTGAWIVKNSWGTEWGGTCGYGTEGGYFTVGYGSRTFGGSSSFVNAWQDYDPNGDVFYYNEAGMTNAVGYGTTTAWGLSKFFPSRDMDISRVEFYTLDKTTDIDVYLYDDFDGTAPDNLLWSSLNHSFDEAGYHGVQVAPPLAVADNDDIVVVIKITDVNYTYPVAIDGQGPHETGRTYTRASGGTWEDAANYGDLAIRLRARIADGENAPPYAPSSPSPLDGATEVSTGTDLGWTGGDPNSGDSVTYDVYLEADDSTPEDLVCGDATSTSCDPGSLDPDTHYYWYVEASDDYGATITGETWDFITRSEPTNNPPYQPDQPSPEDGASDQDINVDLSWTSDDPDAGDMVTYDVYLEADDSTPEDLVCGDATTTSCDPGTLDTDTRYYWYVEATDSHDATATGETWTFTTKVGGLTYLPLLAKRYPPIPDVPVLHAISNPDGDGNYTVSWDAAYLADTYVLQEDDSAGFSSPMTRYSASGTSWHASDKARGTYYYRVKARNAEGESGWSNIRRVTVSPPMAEVSVGNDTGGELCYEVDGTGIGRKCFPSGEHYYGSFPPGTYTWHASARCGSASDTEYYDSGEWTHWFWCD